MFPKIFYSFYDVCCDIYSCWLDVRNAQTLSIQQETALTLMKSLNVASPFVKGSYYNRVPQISSFQVLSQLSCLLLLTESIMMDQDY